jgi:hypothetical protein
MVGHLRAWREKFTWLFDELKVELIPPCRDSFDISSLRFDLIQWPEATVGHDAGKDEWCHKTLKSKD